MKLTHLPSNLKATPLLVLLFCCVGVVYAGPIPTNYKRHNDPRSPPSATETQTNADRKLAATGHEVEATKSRQRMLLVKGKRAHEVPMEVSDWFQDNGTAFQQRVVRQARSGGTCMIERMVEDQGQCIHVGSMPACSTDTHIDLNNAACTTTR